MIRNDSRPHFYPVSSDTELQSPGITSDAFGLRLSAASSASPIGIESADGSVGRLVLPRGFAIDSQLRCYFADRETGDIRFYDSSQANSPDEPFVRLLHFTPPAREDRWKLWSLAANSCALYIVRPDRPEIMAVACGQWAIQEIHRFSDQEWTIDVATWQDDVFALTDRAVYVQRARRQHWQPVCRLPVNDDLAFTRLLISRTGDVLVVASRSKSAPSATESQLWSVASQKFVTLDRTQFPIPHVVTHPVANREQRFQYLIPATLASVCDRQTPELDRDLPPELEVPQVTLEMLTNADLSQGFLVREDGTRIRRQDFRPSTQRVFLTGQEEKRPCRWISMPVDSHRYRCRWDRVELQLQVPIGGRVIVSTQTFDIDAVSTVVGPQGAGSELQLQLRQSVPALPESSWSVGATFEGSPRSAQATADEAVDFLVRSPPGRFLCLRIQMLGDGFSTPVVRRVMAKGPRQSDVDFLPAVMREDDTSREFMERFVSVFQTEWDRLEGVVDQMDRMFNPATISPLQLGRLSNWLGIPLPAGWTPEQNRRFLQFAPRLLMAPEDEQRRLVGGTRRGTVEHLRNAVRAVLIGLTGLTETELQGYPWVIEGFRERKQLHATSTGASRDRGQEDRLTRQGSRALWGPDTTGRLQLGDNSVLGERRLLPTSRQELDLYNHYAHRVRVVVPACWVRRPEDLTALEAMIDAEKPAHVVCEITLVQPGIRVGMQATIGVDTILSDPPGAVLGAAPAPTVGLGQGLTLPGRKVQRDSPPTLQGPPETDIETD